MLGKKPNTTDATRGQSLKARVEGRQAELEMALAKMGPTDRGRDDIERALNEVTSLLTGNLDQIPGPVAEDLSAWLESNKHVNEWQSYKKERHPRKKAAVSKHAVHKH